MVHPLIPEILDLATPIADDLHLTIVNAVFQTNQNPPVLRVDVRNLDHDTSLRDCESMSRALEEVLDGAELIPHAYVLEVSSPGVPKTLTRDREFISFKGFPVIVSLQDSASDSTPNSGPNSAPNSAPNSPGLRQRHGQLIRRDETHLYLSQKGRTLKIPRSEILAIELAESEDP